MLVLDQASISELEFWSENLKYYNGQLLWNRPSAVRVVYSDGGLASCCNFLGLTGSVISTKYKKRWYNMHPPQKLIPLVQCFSLSFQGMLSMLIYYIMHLVLRQFAHIICFS